MALQMMCRGADTEPGKAKVENLLVMGKSGAGKQPRIDVLVEEFGLQQLSTGNLFREYLGCFDRIGYRGPMDVFHDRDAGGFLADAELVRILGGLLEGQDTAAVLLGLKAKYFVENGKLVPDDITNALFESFFARSGFKGMVLDGYPRTPEQARFLHELTSRNGTRLDAIILVENDDATIVARTVGRRICPDCKKVFHLEFKPPRNGTFCTECGSEVVLRSDDGEPQIRSRLQEFRDKVVPALEFLKKQGVPVVTVSGDLPVLSDAAVRADLMNALEQQWGLQRHPVTQ